MTKQPVVKKTSYKYHSDLKRVAYVNENNEIEMAEERGSEIIYTIFLAHAHTHTYTNTHTHTNTHKHTYTYTYTYRLTHTHTHLQNCRLFHLLIQRLIS